MAIAFVQDVTGQSGVAQTTSRTLGSSTSNGNAIVVVVANYGGGTTHTVTDNKGNSYSLVAQRTGTQGRISIYLAVNISGGASHAVTVNQASQSYQSLTVLEYSGVATASAVDSDADAAGSTTTPGTGTVAVNQAGTLVIGAFTHEGATDSFTPTSGTARAGFDTASATAPIFVADLLDQSSGVAIAWSGSAAPAWVAAGVSLKPGGAVPADPTNLSVANVTATQADLSWDTSDDEDGTYLEIDTVNTFDSPDLQQLDITGDSTETVNLEPGTTYYWRVQTYNSQGASAWVNGSSFATDTTPTVTTATPASVTSTTASLGGEVTADGGATVTESGVCYNTTGTPTTSDTKLPIASGVGTFDDIATGLTPGTLYYVRAYAINSVGTAYGSQETFTTLDLATGRGPDGVLGNPISVDDRGRRRRRKLFLS
ncbi:MAG: fibronectin type III domain-containing protein [Phycisphaerales bacterium]|nr:fibronectin type III domain-containing protein [Phycisphaerales bacterium]